MIRDEILDLLSLSSSGEGLKSITTSSCDEVSPETLAACELLCRYSPEISAIEDRWTVIKKNQSARVLAEINNYSESTGKKIFRLTAALEGLPVHEHPTQDEIEKAIELSNGKFILLPNSMVKRNS